MQPVTELIDVERIARQLRLLNNAQSENLAGSWERGESEDHFFWSDSMFILHEIPIAPDNLISLEEAASFIHPSDLERQNREELEETGYADFRFRLGLNDNKIKYIHAIEKKIIENNAVVYQGC